MSVDEGKLRVLYWGRVLLGLFLGVVNSLFWAGGQFIQALSSAGLIYVITYYIFKRGLRIRPEDVGGDSKLWLVGLGGFFFTWLFVWGLLYTLLHIK